MLFADTVLDKSRRIITTCIKTWTQNVLNNTVKVVMCEKFQRRFVKDESPRLYCDIVQDRDRIIFST